jgi:hypothetical protein
MKKNLKLRKLVAAGSWLLAEGWRRLYSLSWRTLSSSHAENIFATSNIHLLTVISGILRGKERLSE